MSYWEFCILVLDVFAELDQLSHLIQWDRLSNGADEAVNGLQVFFVHVIMEVWDVEVIWDSGGVDVGIFNLNGGVNYPLV